MLSDWIPYVIVRDEEILERLGQPTRYSTYEPAWGLRNIDHVPEYPGLRVDRMLEIDRSIRDRERNDDDAV